MRTFVNNHSAPQTTLAKSALPDQSHFGQSHELSSLRLVHDFSQIPIFPGAYSDVQAKLTVSTPGDLQEQEADQVADAVVRMEWPVSENVRRTPGTSAKGPHPLIQRQVEPEENQNAEEGQSALQLDIPEGEEEDGSILPKLLTPGVAPASTIDVKNLNASTGQALSPSARRFMEPRFGYDFSSVRIHTDPEADQLARSINAAAFTHGRDIYFSRGRFDHLTGTGRRLLAHELTHVVQQGGGDKASVASNIQRSLLRRPEIHANQKTTAPGVWRTVEAHVNLRQPQRVRIYNDAATPQDFETSAGTGRRTSRLIRRRPYHIVEKRDPPTSQIGRWGLQYFARFHGGVGFHSNICYPRPDRTRTVLTVDGTPHSHGCMRLRHGDSQTVYNALSVGDDVYIYDRATFRSPSWGSSTGSSSPSSSATSRTYVVVAGDTLSEIAARFGVTAEAIARANSITDIHSIRAGQELTIPAASE